MQTIQAQIHDVTPSAVLPTFSEFARLLDVEIEAGDGRLSLTLAGGRIGMEPAGSGLALRLEAETERRLYLLQQMVLNRLDRMSPVPRLDWETVDVGALPPNLAIATVDAVRQISPNFRRVRVRMPDVAAWVPDGLHFRLVISALPADAATGGSVMEWPVIDASGRTRWPSGDRALHRPVYTVRDIDAAAGWMDFDVYLHEGGRVSGWTGRAGPGDRIGLMGPTSIRRDLPGWVALFGDETALPAIALHLARLPAATRGRAVIALGDQADRQDMAHPQGVAIDWIDRTPGALAAAIRETTLPASDRYVYVGAERAEADAARTWLRDERGLSRTEANVTSFWTRGEVE